MSSLPGASSRGAVLAGDCAGSSSADVKVFDQVGSDDGAIQDLLRGFDVPFHQQRRNEEGFAVGVEAGAAGAIVGEEFGDVVVDAEQVADGVVVFAAIEAAQGDGAGEVSHGAGGLPQAVVDPGGDAQAVVFGELGFHRRHGAVAKLGGDVAPQAAVRLDVLNGIRFEEIDAVPGIIRVVAGGAVLGEDGTDGFGELVLGCRGGSQGEKYAADTQERTRIPQGRAHRLGRGPPPHGCR